MKILSLSLMTISATLLSGSVATAQTYQMASHGHEVTEGSTTYQPADWNSCPSGQCNTGHHHGAACGHGCNHGMCAGLSYDKHSNCPMGMCASSNGCMTNSCLSNTCVGRFCATKAFPDSGWAPPARLPVNRDRIWYGNYLPQAAYGNQGGGFIANYPQVYQPTDTTQLGYYYANVPTWQSRPGMIPPVPNPAEFHSRVAPVGYGYDGHSTCNCGPNAYSYLEPQVAVHRPQIVRPNTASKNSGSRNWFRLSSLSNLID